jgi:flagellin
MSLSINTNIASLNAQRTLNASQKVLHASLQRLSSGKRINSAKDDAAGLAISERFTTQIRGMNQSVRNANDAVSMAQTAEGSLGEIGNNLQRIRELAVQSRNATNSASDRQALQTEANELKSEIDRLAAQTEFNGNKLLDGSFTNKSFQVGANVGESINIASIANATVANLGTWQDDSVVDNFVVQPAGPAVIGADVHTSDISLLSLNTTNATELEAKQDLLTKVASFLSQHVAVFADFDSNSGDLTVTNVAWANISIGLSAIGGPDGWRTVGQSFVLNIDDVTVPVVQDADQTQTGFTNLNISTIDGADKAILAMDGALEQVNSARANLGAIQNRFESVIANLQTTAENMTATRSRILDADFAVETANLTRGQIMQQAGTAILAQANTLPQSVLSLLQ